MFLAFTLLGLLEEFTNVIFGDFAFFDLFFFLKFNLSGNDLLFLLVLYFTHLPCFDLSASGSELFSLLGFLLLEDQCEGCISLGQL